ncbi:MAG: hypothetical protein COZ06_27705 [Armatimonadetes bacterium CG_4_10_14_3_um_filter_66_18]|nr:YgiT-type zinc finger protein [Armatimonadota bacterium]PIU88949.1 MAG: hypothetical protein COS65_29695 [Armatimonadetes bacterium CG06_land_8_20_14_3_00_66_21]PIX36867.1 MAG: hypothetical protein COZ57_37290 [Armatimonadetes bacterium CG_4_8_14_3_um_filter_66_20]PIY40778.1 MAG: hypothetical protein COZ06_27705 [Armatimonadetes bacterium CG_4_10_14_3_um_filter_66_18]PIZ32684.1 MAG: hypothetical protein COY42_30945 [Armatimonadetes bacterium CG_4_10_14_0_8_um_filter_66_14]PJB62013.1 MAG: hy
MSQFPLNPCSACGGEVRSQTIPREFSREGTTVRIEGVRALVCVKCGEVYFEPGATDALLGAANALFALSRQNHQVRDRLVGVAP